MSSYIMDDSSYLFVEYCFWNRIGLISGAGALNIGASDIIEILTYSFSLGLELLPGSVNCTGALKESIAIWVSRF